MTTLAEDQHSWKASGLRRRDFRHSHDGPEVPRHVGAKKNGRWCRGKVGREHTPGQPIASSWCIHIDCEVCGKRLSYQLLRWRSCSQRA